MSFPKLELVLILLVLGMFSISFSVTGAVNTPSTQLLIQKLSSPISINGDADFANQAKANGWLGNGSKSNPYTIENLTFNQSVIQNDIVIQNVQSSFIIRNNTFLDFSTGILINSSSAGTIENNNFNGLSQGIIIQNSTSIKIENNTISNTHWGIMVFKSSLINIGLNKVINGIMLGISIDNSNKSLIEGNLIFNINSPAVLSLYKCQNVTLLANTIINTKHSYGIEVQFSVDINITKNVVSGNGPYSFYLKSNSRINLTLNKGYNNSIQYFLLNTTLIQNRMNAFQSRIARNLTYLEGTSGHILNWTFLDSSPFKFVVYKNNTLFKTGNWVSNISSIINFDGLSKGIYNMTIVYTNGYGDSVSYLVWVTVLYNPTPTPTPSPSPTPTTPVPSPTPTPAPSPTPTPTTPVPSPTPTPPPSPSPTPTPSPPTQSLPPSGSSSNSPNPTPPVFSPTLPTPGFVGAIVLVSLLVIVYGKRRKK